MANVIELFNELKLGVPSFSLGTLNYLLNFTVTKPARVTWVIVNFVSYRNIYSGVKITP